MKRNSGDNIRQRLLKNASKLLGMENSEIATLDPVVSMLFGALSKELEKVYQEQESSKARVLDRLSKLLLPEVKTGAFPGHTVVHARPYENKTILKSSAQFYFRKKRTAAESSYRDEFQDIYFAPLDNTEIVNSSVKYIVTRSGLFETSDHYLKEKISDLSSKPNSWSDSSCWIGIETEELKSEPELNLALYFDWPANPDRIRLIEFLPYVKVSVNNKVLRSEMGNSMTSLENEEVEVLDHFGLFSSNKKAIRSFYSRHFVSFSIQTKDLLDSVPDDLGTCLDDSSLREIDSQVAWIRLDFPPFLTSEVLDEMICSLNAVPVCNLKMNEFSFRIQPNFNIVPLDVGDDFFYQIISVKSSDGKEYITSSISDSNKVGKGEYIVRKGGVERFDNRNAEEMLSYLIDLLKDESASFSVFGHEAISTDLTLLNQQITALNQKVKSGSENRETASYLMVQPRSKSDTVFVEYWSTGGESSSSIKLGTSLMLASDADVQSSDLIVLSNVVGAKDPVGKQSALKNFKSALTNRNRVVTKADIRSFCEEELDGLIDDVNVSLSYDVSTNSSTGFEKVLLIELTPNKSVKLEDNKWQALLMNLRAKIDSKSPFINPVRIKLAK